MKLFKNNSNQRYIYCMWENINTPNTNYDDVDNWLLAFYKDKHNKLRAWEDMGVTYVKPYVDSEFWLSKQDIKRINDKYHIKLNMIPVNDFQKFVAPRATKHEFKSDIRYFKQVLV